MRTTLLAAGLLSFVSGCSTTAFVTGRWVFLTGGETMIATGEADRPQRSAPLHLVPGSAGPGACLTAEELDESFGETCENEEERSEYVRWYCGGNLAVRVRLEACEERRDRYRVAELAVATHYRD